MSIGTNVKKAVLTRTVDGIVNYLQVDPVRRIKGAIDFAYTFALLPV